MQGTPCYARLFADLTRTPQGAFSCPFGTIHLVSPNPIIASGGQSRAPPVAGGARRKPSEQGSARKAPRADAARPLRTALRPPNPPGFFDRLRIAGISRLSISISFTGFRLYVPQGFQQPSTRSRNWGQMRRGRNCVQGALFTAKGFNSPRQSAGSLSEGTGKETQLLGLRQTG